VDSRPWRLTGNPFRQKATNVINEATLKRLSLPTVLITGEADLYSPPALIRMVAAQIPNSEVVIMREPGHSSYWEQPDEFNRAVLDFLARYSKSDPERR
jgi:pimeloyl-ACP methyl ester carboxylesterase